MSYPGLYFVYQGHVIREEEQASTSSPHPQRVADVLNAHDHLVQIARDFIEYLEDNENSAWADDIRAILAKVES